MAEDETETGARGRPEDRAAPGPGRGHPIGRMFLIGTIASVIGVVLVLLIDWFPVGASAAADDVDLLYDVTLIVAVPIFVLVMAVAIYSVVRFRARPGDTRDGAPIHGNARLEVIWVAVPTLIVSVLAAYSWIVLDEIEAREPDSLQVSVRAQQFAWAFQYPQAGGRPIESEELVVPEGRQVNFSISAVDVIHSFWIPAFRIKQDAVPGIETETRAVPIRAGRYDVVCTELCGSGHSTMRQNVRVLPPPEFDRWLAAQRGAAGASQGAAARTEAGVPTGARTALRVAAHR
ncbi:MAG: Cytochrome c oxidase polypeptide II [uncultured Solirubrobacterales bacterium]|uniref:Cytochrome c oxidase subunit 2 n=1 Tax=uncultured Solirubrobacterales bacterium TaxID=768556 RepID=A0A6J4SY41_9ACTN|nr:MAG: Cytochrome c oxidase polypeptide II [uncultured Solirubrobacterales bacterium]